MIMRIIFSFRFIFSIACIAFICLAIYIYDTTAPSTKNVAGTVVMKTLQDAPVATPELTTIFRLPESATPAYATRAKLPGSDSYVGMAFVCSTSSPSGLTITTPFGSFPSDRRPVQLAGRTTDDQVFRWGAVVAAGPESGFHSPQLLQREDVEPFLFAALRPGSLISNGYRSFWNRLSPGDNQQTRDSLLAWLRSSS